MTIRGESSTDAIGSENVHISRSTFDSFDPLFLQILDIPGVNLAHCVLTGLENYTLWSKSTRLT